MYILYNMTICSVYPIENYNRGMGGNSNFVRPMFPTYRGCIVLIISVKQTPTYNIFRYPNFYSNFSHLSWYESSTHKSSFDQVIPENKISGMII